MLVSTGNRANETDILCAKFEHSNYGHRGEDSHWRRTTSNHCDSYGESAIRHIEKRSCSVVGHIASL